MHIQLSTIFCAHTDAFFDWNEDKAFHPRQVHCGFYQFWISGNFWHVVQFGDATRYLQWAAASLQCRLTALFFTSIRSMAGANRDSLGSLPADAIAEKLAERKPGPKVNAGNISGNSEVGDTRDIAAEKLAWVLARLMKIQVVG